MPFVRTIQWKAFLMLTVFAVNFMIVCHCSARTAEPACCAKKETKSPCKDDNGCSGMHAVKFNLLEKKASSHIELDPVFAIVFTSEDLVFKNDARFKLVSPDKKFYTGIPPDLQSLYQCFRI